MWLPRRSERLTRIDVAHRDDIAQPLRPRHVYVAGQPAKWLVLDCPCRTGHRIDLNLAHQSRTRWRIDTDIVTVHPSVHVRRDGEADCHFIIRDGAIIWCTSPPRPSPVVRLRRLLGLVIYALRPSVLYGEAHGEVSTGAQTQARRSPSSAEANHREAQGGAAQSHPAHQSGPTTGLP